MGGTVLMTVTLTLSNNTVPVTANRPIVTFISSKKKQKTKNKKQNQNWQVFDMFTDWTKPGTAKTLSTAVELQSKVPCLKRK
jgi:hypothetical protein